MKHLKTTTKIDSRWSAYDQSVAKCHLANYGFILLDEYGVPRDDVLETEDVGANALD